MNELCLDIKKISLYRAYFYNKIVKDDKGSSSDFYNYFTNLAAKEHNQF